ncbi:pilus assembly FimT family protein [Maricaulis maris]|uniref:pilus assembly FimT family protein n=1 Tax=Maricaulis maris TaxID=74318 RepID=UPI003B8DD114
MTVSRRNRGFSLFEMLAALVVLSLATGLVASRIRPDSASDRLDQATALLADDLRRAQLQARRAASPVPVTVTETGYRIDAVSVHREWPTGLDASWQSRRRSGWGETDTLNMAGRPLSREEARIVLRLETVERVVRLDAISGQIHVDRSM